MTDATQKVENVDDKGILKKYALVIADVNGLGTKSFSYSIPDDLREKIKYGSPVVVPFGVKNAVNGFVVGFSDTLDGDFKVKPILDVLTTMLLLRLTICNFCFGRLNTTFAT